MPYNKILKVLKSLPKRERVLATGVYVFAKGECGCVLGKTMPSLYKYAPRSRKNAFAIRDLILHARKYIVRKKGRALVYSNILDQTRKLYEGIVRDMKKLDVTDNELIGMQTENDAYFSSFDENSLGDRQARYVHMIQWLRARILDAEQLTA